MLDHIGFEVSDLERSKAFYTQALGALGATLLADLKEYGAAGFGIEKPDFWIGAGKPSSGREEVHVCFKARNRAEVRAFYDAAIKAGATDNGKPGLRPEYHENYYGAFVLDLDGHNIEACCHKPE